MSKAAELPLRQADIALALARKRGLVRLSEFLEQGITAATVSRLERSGALIRLSRGLYQLPDAPLDAHHALAEAAKRMPRGVICLTSALAFHGLTDQMPPRVWVAIGQKDWKPRLEYPPVQIVRFADADLKVDVEIHEVESTQVRVFSMLKTLTDMFRRRRAVGINLAIEGLRAAIRQRKTTPAEIAQYAVEARMWTIMQPYVETISFDG